MPESATSYRVNTGFVVNSRIPGLRSVNSQLRTLNSTVNQVTRSFLLIVAVRGVHRLTRAVLGLNAEVQNAELSIGAAFSAFTGTQMATSMSVARAELRKLRQDAAKLPGELSDYIRTYNQITGAVLGAGGDQHDIRDLTRLGIVGATAVNPLTGMRNIGFDITQALTSGANQRTTRDLVLLLNTVGMTVEEFNKLAKPERMQAIFTALNAYATAAEEMGKTWTAQTSTLKDNFNEITRQTTRPLFDRLTEDLIQVNALIERNGEATQGWADLVAGNLLAAYTRLKAVMPRSPEDVRAAAAAPVTALGAAGIASVGAGIASQFVSFISSVPNWIPEDRLTSLGMIGDAVKNQRHKGLLPSIGAMGAVSMGLLESNFTALIAAVTPLIAPLAAIVAGVAAFGGMIIGTFMMFPSILSEAAQAGGGLLFTLGKLLVSIGKLLFLNPLVVGLGVAVLQVANIFTRVVSIILGIVGKMVDYVATTLMGVTSLFKDSPSGPAAAVNSFLDDVEKMFGLNTFAPLVPEAIQRKPEGGELNKRTIPDTTNNFNGPISITIKPEKIDNPNLLARDIESVFNYLAEYKRGGRGAVLTPRST